MSWNVQGGVSPADGSDFLPTIMEDIGFRPDIWFLQECGDPGKSIPVSAHGYEAFGDGHQRGNAILLSTGIATAVIGKASSEHAFVVALKLDNGTVLALCSAHLPCAPASQEDYEAALEGLSSAIRRARGSLAGPVLLGCDANAGPVFSVPDVVGDLLLQGTRPSNRFQLFLELVLPLGVKLVNTYSSSCREDPVAWTRTHNGSFSQIDFVGLPQAAEGWWTRLHAPRATASDHCLLAGRFRLGVRLGIRPRLFLTARGWTPTAAVKKDAWEMLDNLPSRRTAFSWRGLVPSGG